MIQTLGSLSASAGHDVFSPQFRGYDSPENPHTSLDKISEMLTMGQGGPTATGLNVGPENALTVSTIWRCASAIASIARMPLLTFKRLPEVDGFAGKQEAPDHYAYGLFRRAVHPRFTAYRWLRQQIMWILFWGNGYSVMQISRNGRVTGLMPVHPAKVEWDATNDVYKIYGGSSSPIEVHPDAMLHFRGLELDDSGLGMSILSKMRESAGVAIAQKQFEGSFYGRGATMTGFFTIPESMGDTAKLNMIADIKKKYQGARAWNGIGILDGGTDFKTMSMPMRDAEFALSGAASVADLGRFFGVPKHMLNGDGDVDIDAQAVEFLKFGAGPYISLIETEINNSVFSETEALTYFVEFDQSLAMMGDPEKKARVLNIERQNGVINANTWRHETGRNPIEGEDGQVYLHNGNMMDNAEREVAKQTNKKQIKGAPNPNE